MFSTKLMLFMFICLFTHFCPVEVLDDLPDDRKIRMLLSSHDAKEELQALVVLGDKLFPAYERIMADKDATDSEIIGIFATLNELKGDRRRFLQQAIEQLSSRYSGARRGAVTLLATIGSDRDTPAIIAMFSDEDFTVGVAAAKAIQAIGGPRDLTAMNTWLSVSNNKKYTPEYQAHYDVLRKKVTLCRDELKQRLEKEKKDKK